MSVGRSFEMFLRWKKEVLQMCLMWASKFRWGSIITPRLVTTGERGRSCPEKLMLVMGDVFVWCGVPIRIISVLELFSCKKLLLIHAFISSRQVVRVDRGDSDDEDDDEDGVAGRL